MFLSANFWPLFWGLVGGGAALTALLSAFINVRIAAPVVAGIGLAATFGAGVTAQLGAMRISEEIDALEAMAIRPISYLVSTRIVAGMLAITPLYSIAVILSFLASQITTTTSTPSSTPSTWCGRSCRRS